MSRDPTTRAMETRGTCDPRFSAVREAFAESFRSRDEVGATVAVTLDGHSVVDLWGGFLDADRQRPWRRDTLVCMMSVAKAVTATCAHVLVDRGMLDVDAPVARYWPEFAANGKERLPVCYILDHRAGLPAHRSRHAGGRRLRLAGDDGRLGRSPTHVGAGRAPRLSLGHHGISGGRSN